MRPRNDPRRPVPVLSRSRPARRPGAKYLYRQGKGEKRDSGTANRGTSLQVRARTRQTSRKPVPLSRFLKKDKNINMIGPGQRAGRDRDRTGTGVPVWLLQTHRRAEECGPSILAKHGLDSTGGGDRA